MAACGVPEILCGAVTSVAFFKLYISVFVSQLTRKGVCGTHHAVQVLVVIGADGLAIQQYAAALQRVEVL